MKKTAIVIIILTTMFSTTGCRKNKAPNCESPIVKNLILDIIKKDDSYFKYIDPNTISKVYLKDILATNYDKDIDKYSCKANFVVKSTDRGFFPKEYNPDNIYWRKFSYMDEFSYSEDIYIAKNTQYILDIKYISQLSEGKPYVEQTIDDKDIIKVLIGNFGEFSCESENCEPILIEATE